MLKQLNNITLKDTHLICKIPANWLLLLPWSVILIYLFTDNILISVFNLFALYLFGFAKTTNNKDWSLNLSKSAIFKIWLCLSLIIFALALFEKYMQIKDWIELINFKYKSFKI